MVGWFLFVLSAYAAFLWGHWFAIANAAVKFWALGIMSSHAAETGIHAPARNDWERLVITINAATSFIGVALFFARIGAR